MFSERARAVALSATCDPGGLRVDVEDLPGVLRGVHQHRGSLVRCRGPLQGPGAAVAACPVRLQLAHCQLRQAGQQRNGNCIIAPRLAPENAPADAHT